MRCSVNKTTAEAIFHFSDNKYKPDGYSVGWNCGEVGGQHVFHSHLHVVPQHADEPFAGRGIRSWIKSEENKRPSQCPE